MRLSLRQRLESSSGRFVKTSLLLAVGFAVARVLGLLFSLLLGKVLPAADYGAIQYSILLAGIIGIGAQPLLQHTLARFVSVHRAEPRLLDQAASTIFVLLAPITLLTLALTWGYFTLSGVFDYGALIIFAGMTIYYAYHGLARGFEDSTRLSVAFIASNLVQFLALVAVYYLLGSRSILPALAIYGLSYVLPVFYLSIAHPLPVRLSPRLASRSMAGEVLRFSLPVWGSHTLFAVGVATEVILLTQLVDGEAAGVFAFTRTLCFAFDFLPSAIATIIMPRAAVAGDSRRLTLTSLGLTLLVNAAIGVVFLLLYPWFVGAFFDASYLLPSDTVLVMIAGQTVNGMLGIVQSVTVGKNRPQVELASRVINVGWLYTACLLLIPLYGVHGAALAGLSKGLVGLATFPLLLRFMQAGKEQGQEEHGPS